MMTRQMVLQLLLVLLCSILAVASASPTSASTSQQSEAPRTLMATPVGAIAPSLTPTPTPNPTIQGIAGIPIPSEPLLTSTTQLYTKVMGLNTEQVLKSISYRQFKGKDGNPFEVALTADHTPLLIYDSANGWREATRAELGTKRGMLIAIDARGWKIALGDRRYADTLVSDGNHFQMDDMCDWNRFERDHGYRAYTTANPEIGSAINLAQKFHKTLSAGCGIVWGFPDALPPWLKNARYSKEQLLSILDQHTETFLTPVKDSVQRVAVVNEVLPHPLGIPNFWIDTNGISRDLLLQHSFRKARAILPDAELSLREFSVEFAGYPRSEEFFNLVKRVNDEERVANGRNLIDAVEFQLPLLNPALIGKDPAMNPSYFVDNRTRSQMIEKLRQSFRRFRAIGVNVYITELLLPIDNLPGTMQQKLHLQADIYADIYRVCAEEGVGVGLFVQNWSQDTGYPPESTLPYPRDENYEPLPSYYAINAAILSSAPQPTDTPTPTSAPIATAITANGPTPTPVPTIPLTNAPGVPYPSDYELTAAVALYSRALGLDSNQVRAGLTYRALKDSKAALFVTANTSSGVPLLFARKAPAGSFVWSPTRMKDLGDALGILYGGMIEKYPGTEGIYRNEFNAGLVGSAWGLNAARGGVSSDLDFSAYEDFQYRFGQQVAGYDAQHMLFNHIIWNAYMPKEFADLGKDQAIAWMKTYIRAVMDHFHGKIRNYVVVNEPHPIFGQVKDDPLRRIIGPDYIDIAFQTAREVNPDAFLIFNETDNHGPEGRYVKNTVEIGNTLFARGLIDAIGVQGHLYYTDSRPAPTEDQMLAILNQYKAPIVLTEVDASIVEVHGGKRLAVQAEWYRRLISACLRTGRCKGIFLWGAFPDEHTYVEQVLHQQNADPTPWDDSFNPKPAYYAILQALYSGLTR